MGEKNSKQGVRRSRRGMAGEGVLQDGSGSGWPTGTVYQGLQLPEMGQIRARSQRSRSDGCVSITCILLMCITGEHVHHRVPKRGVFRC